VKSGLTVLPGLGPDVQLFSAGQDIIHRFAPLHCAVTAGAGLPPFTPEKAGAAGSFGVSAAA